MSNLPRIRHDGKAAVYLCPGCGDTHRIPTDRWSWNGSLDRPTLSPSINAATGHYTPNFKQGDSCWCGKDYGFECSVCHHFVIDGRIQFLGDCTHHLKGQTVDLPDLTNE